MVSLKALRFLFVVASLFISTFAVAEERYPVGPNPNMTPGAICENSKTRRYPEGIVYCERNVNTADKRAIIKAYDDQLGFSIQQMDRGEFKIDHFIPLSIGGSNSKENLWPQHRSVYTITDPLEQVLFEKISVAAITQAEAIRVIREAKLNLDRVPELIDYVQAMQAPAGQNGTQPAPAPEPEVQQAVGF